MLRTYISVGNRELIDVLYRIARNERVAPGRRIESVELIARLKGLRGFQTRRPKGAPAPPATPAPVLVSEPIKLAPVIDLLGVNNDTRRA